MERKKNGFSFIELILILVFFFLILAALMPMITRRHLAPPTRANHGTYACYWQKEEDGTYSLRETLVKGKKTIVDNQQVSEDVGCRFESPRKAKYFYVQIIGGGGGGRGLDWESEVNPANVEKYRIFGEKEMSKDDEGYLVKATKMKTYDETLPAMGFGESQYLELIPYKFGGSEFMYLHGTSGDGAVCSGREDQGGTCNWGDGRRDAYCLAKTSTSCTSITPEILAEKNITQFENGSSTTYSYSCTDTNHDGYCDNNEECTGYQLACTEEEILKFSAESDIETVTCANPLNDSGISAYREVRLGGIASMVTSKTTFVRHDENHDRCKYYWERQMPLEQSDWDNYKVQSGVPLEYRPFKYRSASGVQWMPNGQGVWFEGRAGDDSAPLYVCGGQGAERGVRYENNPRIANSDTWCSPAYANPANELKSKKESCSSYSAISALFTGSLDQCGCAGTACAGTLILGTKPKVGPLPPAATNKTDLHHHDYLALRIIFVNLKQHQELPYGVGGRAGDIKTLILKTVPDGVYIMPGKGGAGGLNPEDGEDSFFGSDAPGSPLSEKVAYGGKAGKEIYSIDAEIGPYISGTTKQSYNKSRSTTTENEDSRFGGTISYAAFVKFVISYNSQQLRDRMELFGRGGDGAATMTSATCGYDYEAFALYDKNKTPAFLRDVAQPGKPIVPSSTFIGGCNHYAWNKLEKPEGITDRECGDDGQCYKTDGFYWGYYANGPAMSDHAMQIVKDAQDGQTGAIVISW